MEEVPLELELGQSNQKVRYYLTNIPADALQRMVAQLRVKSPFQGKTAICS